MGEAFALSVGSTMPYDISRVKVGDQVRDNQTRKEGRIVDITTVGQWGVILTIAFVGASKIDIGAVLRGAPAGTNPPDTHVRPTEQTGHPPLNQGVELETASGSVSKKISIVSRATDKEAHVVARKRGYAKPTWAETPEGLQRLRRFIDEAPKRGATLPEIDRKRLLDLVDRLAGREIGPNGKNTGQVFSELRRIFRVHPDLVGLEPELRALMRKYIPGASTKDVQYLIESIVALQRGSIPGIGVKFFDCPLLSNTQTLLNLGKSSGNVDVDQLIASLEHETGLGFQGLRNIKTELLAEVAEQAITSSEYTLRQKELGLPAHVGQRPPDAEIRNVTEQRFNLGAVNHALDSGVTLEHGLTTASLAEMRQAVQRFGRMTVYRDGWEAIRAQAELIAEGVLSHNLFAGEAFDAQELLQAARQLRPGKMGAYYNFQRILRQTDLLGTIMARNEGVIGPDDIMEGLAPQVDRSFQRAQQVTIDDLAVGSARDELRKKLRTKRTETAALERWGEDLRYGKRTFVDTEQGLRMEVLGTQTAEDGSLNFLGRVASSSVRDPGEFGLLTNVHVVSDARNDILSALMDAVRGPESAPGTHPAVAGAVANPAVGQRLDAMSVKIGSRSVRVTDFLKRSFSEIAPEATVSNSAGAYDLWLRSQLAVMLRDKSKIIEQASGVKLIAGADDVEDAIQEAWTAYYGALSDGASAAEIHQAAFSAAYKKGLASLYSHGQEINLSSLGVESIWDLPGVGDTAGVITKSATDARRSAAGAAADYALEHRQDLVQQKILDDMSLMLDIDRDFVPIADPITGERVYSLSLRTHVNRERARAWYDTNAGDLLDLESYRKEASNADYDALSRELYPVYGTQENGIVDDWLFDDLYGYIDDLDSPIRAEHSGLTPLINRARTSLRKDRELIRRTYVTAHVANNIDPLPPGFNDIIVRGEQEKPLLTTLSPVGGRRVVYTASANMATGPNGTSVALSPDVEAAIPSRFVLKDRGVDARDQEYLQHLVDNYRLSAEETGVYEVGGRLISTGDTRQGLRRQIERLHQLQTSREAQQVLFLDIEAEAKVLRNVPSIGALEVPATAFEAGQRVKHPMFGDGTVAAYADGKVAVDFDAVGTKTLDAGKAGLLRGVTKEEHRVLMQNALKQQTEMSGTYLTEIGIVPGQVQQGRLSIDLASAKSAEAHTVEEEISALIEAQHDIQSGAPTIFTRNKIYDIRQLLKRAEELLGSDSPYTQALRNLANDSTNVVNIDTLLVADIANPDERYQGIEREIRTRASRDPEFRKITGEEYVPNVPESHHAIPDIVDDASLTARNLETQEAKRFVSVAMSQLQEQGEFIAQDLVGKQYWTNTGFAGERSRLLTLQAVVRESDDSNKVRYIWREHVLDDSGNLVDGGLYSPRSSETLVFKQHKLLRGMTDVTDYTDAQKADLLRQTEEDYAGRIARDMRQDPTRYAKEVKRLQMIDEFRGQDAASLLTRIRPYVDDVTMSLADLPEGLDTVVENLRRDYSDQQALSWLAEWGRDPRRRRQTERLRALLDQEFGTIHRQFYNDLDNLTLGSSTDVPITLHEKQKILQRYHNEVDARIGGPAQREDWTFMPGTRKISAKIEGVSDWPMGFNIDSEGAFLNDYERQIDRVIQDLGPGQVSAALDGVISPEAIELFQGTEGMKNRMFLPMDELAGRAGIGESYAGVRALRQHVWEHTIFPAMRANLGTYVQHAAGPEAAATIRRVFATPDALFNGIVRGELSEDVFHAFQDDDPRMYHEPRSVTEEQLEEIRQIQQRILGGSADAEGKTWRDYAGISEEYNSRGELKGYQRPSLYTFPEVENISRNWYGRTIDEIEEARTGYYLAEQGAEKAAGTAKFWMNQQLHSIFMQQDVFESLPDHMQQDILGRIGLNVRSQSGETTADLRSQRSDLIVELQRARESGDTASIETLTSDLADVEHQLSTVDRDIGQIRAGLGDIDVAADLVADPNTSNRVLYELTNKKSPYNEETRELMHDKLVERIRGAQSEEELLQMPYPEDPRRTLGSEFEETSLRESYLESLGIQPNYNMRGEMVEPHVPQPQAEAFGADTTASVVDRVADVAAATDQEVETTASRVASAIPSKFAAFRSYSSKIGDLLEYAKALPYLAPIAITAIGAGSALLAQKPNLDDQEPENPTAMVRDKIVTQTVKPVASRSTVRLKADSEAPDMDDMQHALIASMHATMQQHHESAIQVSSINSDNAPSAYTRRDVNQIAGQLMSPGRPLG